jgi:hypothetical protein
VATTVDLMQLKADSDSEGKVDSANLVAEFKMCAMYLKEK